MIRSWIVRSIRGQDSILSEAQRTWMARTKNGSFLIIVFIVFILWRSEINEFALSLTAIAVAVVVASKEIILCFTGYIQRASSQSFHIGEWIEVGGLTGEVIDHNLIATVIQEIDLYNNTYIYTGKTVTVPNSIFFSTAIKNLNFMKRYVYHEFSVFFKSDINLYPHMFKFQHIVEQHCDDFYEVANRYNQMIERRAGVHLPGASPYLRLSTTDMTDLKLHVRLFCPTERALDLEQTIRNDIMAIYYQIRSEQKSAN